MTLDLNWNAMDDEEFARLLRNSEGKNELERSMFLEAASRIERLSGTRDDINENAMSEDY